MDAPRQAQLLLRGREFSLRLHSAVAQGGVAVTGFLGCENTASFETLFERRKIADHFVRIAGQTRGSTKAGAAPMPTTKPAAAR